MRRSAKKDPSYEGRNAVLDLEDPMGSVVIDGLNETLGETLQDISEYIYHCLQFSDNPLTHLRRYFPKYVWAFHEPKTHEEAAKIISEADYSIPEGAGFTDWSLGFFTATHKIRQERRKMYFCRLEELNRIPDLGYWPHKELEKFGARAVIYDPHATLTSKHCLLIVSPSEALNLKGQQHFKIVGR